MQETRKHILEILKERGQATVDELVDILRSRRGSITAVTVRHHLARLQEEGLIAAPKQRHRDTPGRPQHIYALTQKAAAFFPNNYQQLAAYLIGTLQERFPEQEVNVILDDVADKMAAEVQPEGSLEERLDVVVAYMSEHGYEAVWETCEGGYLLHTEQCPYADLAHDNHLCLMDVRLISQMLGVVPQVVGRIAEGSDCCTYFIAKRAN